MQGPLKIAPLKSSCLNWKVDPFLAWIAWNLGQEFCCDELTIGFKGNHQDKMHISYKREGNYFFVDTMSEDGNTYSFFKHVCIQELYKEKTFPHFIHEFSFSSSI